MFNIPKKVDKNGEFITYEGSWKMLNVFNSDYRFKNHVERFEKFLEETKKDKQMMKCYNLASFIVMGNINGGNNPFIEGFQPIVDLLTGFSYPAAYVMLITGFLLVMCNNKSKGLEVIKWAGVGYVGMQFIPFILQILYNVGRSMRGGA